jgi:hypothetical protein
MYYLQLARNNVGKDGDAILAQGDDKGITILMGGKRTLKVGDLFGKILIKTFQPFSLRALPFNHDDVYCQQITLQSLVRRPVPQAPSCDTGRSVPTPELLPSPSHSLGGASGAPWQPQPHPL